MEPQGWGFPFLYIDPQVITVEEIEDTLRKAETYVGKIKRKGHDQSLVKSTITILVMTLIIILMVAALDPTRYLEQWCAPIRAIT